MFHLTPEQSLEFAAAVREAAALDATGSVVRAIYDAFEAERAAAEPRCDRSGRCCHFEQYGHRLFVTTLEVAAFVRGATVDPPPQTLAWDGTGCAYQVAGACSAHRVRPFGCRVYFCDPTSTAWQHGQYERFHAQLRELHERLGVPYLYVEWRQALAATGLAVPAVSAAAGVSLPVLPG